MRAVSKKRAAQMRVYSRKRVEFLTAHPVCEFPSGCLNAATDVHQGRNGDCWFLAALCAITGKKDLIDRVCVMRDEKVGVYGFVFHRGA